MHIRRFVTEETRAIARPNAFCPGEEEFVELVGRLEDAGRGRPQPALVVAVMDHGGCRLRVLEGPLPQVIVLGRHAASDLSLGQSDASLRHLVVYGDDDGVQVLDLASSFGLHGVCFATSGGFAAVRAGDSVVVAGLVSGAVETDVEALVGTVLSLSIPKPRPTVGNEVASRTQHATFPVEVWPRPACRAPRLDGWSPPLNPIIGRGSISLNGLQSRVLIGRGSRNDVVVEGDGVSRVHAAVVPMRLDGTLRAVLIDAASTNGTEVITRARHRAGVCEIALGPVVRAHVIESGDIIALGSDAKLQVVGCLDAPCMGEQMRFWEGR